MTDQSKPWDLRIDSYNAIPEIFENGKSAFELNHAIVDLVVHWHTNDSQEHPTEWELLQLDRYFESHPVKRYIRVTGNKAVEDTAVDDDINTCEEARDWLIHRSRSQSSNLDNLTVHVGINCSDVIKGLKAVQREARVTAQALKKLDNDS
jgi:hypothetical protein